MSVTDGKSIVGSDGLSLDCHESLKCINPVQLMLSSSHGLLCNQLVILNAHLGVYRLCDQRTNAGFPEDKSLSSVILNASY